METFFWWTWSRKDDYSNFSEKVPFYMLNLAQICRFWPLIITDKPQVESHWRFLGRKRKTEKSCSNFMFLVRSWDLHPIRLNAQFILQAYCSTTQDLFFFGMLNLPLKQPTHFSVLVHQHVTETAVHPMPF